MYDPENASAKDIRKGLMGCVRFLSSKSIFGEGEGRCLVIAKVHPDLKDEHSRWYILLKGRKNFVIEDILTTYETEKKKGFVDCVPFSWRERERKDLIWIKGLEERGSEMYPTKEWKRKLREYKTDLAELRGEI
jgi:hypothetical protein